MAKKRGGPSDPPLTKVEKGFRGRVTSIAGDDADLVCSFGIYVGSEIEIRQKRPSYVIRIEETEIALESSVARQIFVRRSRP